MKNTAISIILLLLLAHQITNYQPTFATDGTWSYSYNGPYNETVASALVQTGDGGYVVLAYTQESVYSERSCWLLKINAYGAIEWNKTIGMPRSDFLRSITPATDGGFALAGQKDFSSTTNNVYSMNGKGVDFWLVKTNTYGNIEWNKTYGGSWHEGANALVRTSDGGYALAGYTWSFEPNGYWLVKTDGNGTLQWSKSCESNYGAIDLIQIFDGGFLLVGTSGPQAKVVKTDENGLTEWSINLGESSQETQDQARSVVETDDGGVVVLGYAYAGLYNAVYSWLSKVNSTGSQEWFQTFDGNFISFAKVSTGGFVLAGSLPNSTNCLVGTDALGNIGWVKPFGNLNSSNVRSLIETVNGFVVTGTADGPTNSSRIVWIMRTDAYGNAPQSFSSAPMPTTPKQPETDSFPILPLTASMVTVAIVGAGLLVYYKKRKHQVITTKN
jgi:hypothetical protein